MRRATCFTCRRYAHDGIAEAVAGKVGEAADCMTYSIGFRAPGRSELAAELLHRLAEFSEDEPESSSGEGRRRASPSPKIYRDPPGSYGDACGAA